MTHSAHRRNVLVALALCYVWRDRRYWRTVAVVFYSGAAILLFLEWQHV